MKIADPPGQLSISSTTRTHLKGVRLCWSARWYTCENSGTPFACDSSPTLAVFHLFGEAFNCSSTNGEQFVKVTPRDLKLASITTPSASANETSVKSSFSLRPSLKINSQTCRNSL